MSYYINMFFNVIIKWFVIIKKGEIVDPKVSNYCFDDNKALDNQMLRLMAFQVLSIGLKAPTKANMQIQSMEQACKVALVALTPLKLEEMKKTSR